MSSILQICCKYQRYQLRKTHLTHYLVVSRRKPVAARRPRSNRRRSGWAAPTPIWLVEDRKRCSSSCAHLTLRLKRTHHTSSASVWVYPVVDDKIEVEINEAMEVQWVMTLGKSGAAGAPAEHGRRYNFEESFRCRHAAETATDDFRYTL